MNADKNIRAAATAAVVAVAAFAAVVSYSHAYRLGVTHGQSGTAAAIAAFDRRADSRGVADLAA